MTGLYDEAIALIIAFVRNVQLKRVFDAGAESHQNFWRIISGNFMDVAVIEWCKLFGNDGRDYQPAHWKNVIPPQDHDAFRAGLLNTVNLTQEQWEDYRDQVKKYRDRNAAHLDVREPRPEFYPKFDTALAATYFYYDKILLLANDAGLARQFPDLRDYADRFLNKADEIAELGVWIEPFHQHRVKYSWFMDEDESFEQKAHFEWGREGQQFDLLKTIVAFANGRGGTIKLASVSGDKRNLDSSRLDDFVNKYVSLRVGGISSGQSAGAGRELRARATSSARFLPWASLRPPQLEVRTGHRRGFAGAHP